MRPRLAAPVVLRLAALGIAGLFAVLVAAPAAAQTPAAELGLEAAAGFGGRGSAAEWQPVEVRIEPTRPVAGTLAVSVRGDAGVTREMRPVEVSAASAKVFRFLVPSGVVAVDLTEAGRDPVTVRPSGQGPGAFLLGVLGEVPAGVPPVRSETVGVSAEWVAVDPAWLDVSPRALESLGTLVADRSVLAELGETARRNLALAVARGTDLVVVADGTDLAAVGDPGGAALAALDLPWLPGARRRAAGGRAGAAAWTLTAADLSGGGDGGGGGGRGGAGAGVVAVGAPAGLGRVLVTSVAPGGSGLGRSSALWSQLAGPSPLARREQGEYRVTSTPYTFARLLAEPGATAPTLPWLGVFALAYVLVVGPVNGLVLARLGRRELAWATVPIVTVVFTAGAFLGATQGRPPSGAAARLAYWIDGAAGELVAAGVRAPTPGQRSVVLPGTDWTVRPLVDSGAGSQVRRDADTVVSMELTALQLGGVAAWRAVAAPAPLRVSARAADTGVRVSVENVSPRTVTDVTVRTATATAHVGDLAPRAVEEVSVGGPELTAVPAYADPFSSDVAFDSDGIVGPPRSLEAALTSELADGSPGLAWAVGVDSGAPAAGVRAGDQPMVDKGTLVAVAAPVVLDRRGGLSPFAVSRELLTGDGELYRPGPLALEGAGQAFLRFRLPPGADRSALTSRLEQSGPDGGRVDLTVWDRRDRQWIDVDDALPATGQGVDRLVSPLGELWVRASGELLPFEFSARTVAGGPQ